MPGQPPNPIRLYRILHFDNVEYALENGLCIRTHPDADPNYINIGDSGLIMQRNDYPVGIIPPGGNLGDYVPFYFGPLSPMLLNIKTGHRGVTRRPQSDIVYLCCRLDSILECCEEWCFTNGHAKDAITDFFNREEDLREVYWDTVGLRYWNPTEDFLGRQTRKQAEFLVKEHVPVDCIDEIVVFNEAKRILVQEIIERFELDITVRVDREYYYY